MVCEDTSGDTSDKCTRQGCHLCKCTEQCVLPFEKEKCPTGCIEYCGQREACKHHGCVYEEPSGICRKPTDPIAGKICSSNNNNPANCMRLGCISCPCSELCVTPSQQDICVTGCAAFCDNAERCVENGCIFDFDTKTCSNETTTLPSVCSKIVSNAPKCKKQGCHPCKCTDQCVLPRLTERCDKGCIEFCMEQQNCTSHMCIYKEANGRCYNHTDPRAREVCDKSTDSTDNICTRQGCHMCKCSYQCVLPIETFRCPKGCPEHCGQREKCVGAGCVYEDSNGNCHNATGPPAERVCRESNGKVDNCRRQGCVYCECNSLCYIPSMAANCPPTCGPSGVVIVAGNVCGEDTVGANGIEYKEDMAWHIAVDDEYDDEDIIFCHKGGVSDSAGEDRVMFSSKLECTHCVRDIPIQEGGNYDIVFHFSELKGTNNRVFSVLLNDVVLIESLHTSDIGPPGTPHSVNKMFTISMDVSKIIIGSTEAVIYDKILEARIKFFKTPGSKIGAAILLNIIVSYTPFVGAQNGDCKVTRPQNPVPSDWSKWVKPLECIGDNDAMRTDPEETKNTIFRTNSIDDFCFVTDMRASAPSPQGPPLPPRTSLPYYNKFPDAKPCYEPSPATPPSHSAGNNPNWDILEHLVRHKAQSFQPYDDLPYVYEYFKGKETDKFITWPHSTIFSLPEISPPLPRPKAPNPYFVEVTGISFKGELLHNFLHFRIFANMSVALGKGQKERSEYLHQPGPNSTETPNYATGKISALQPGMFVFDVDPGRYCTSNMPHFRGGTPVPASTDPDPRMNPQTARLEGVREVHATWSFGHNTCNFVQRLYIQTLIFEDVETVYPAYLSKKPSRWPKLMPDGSLDRAFEASDASFLFGWTAQYNILKPTSGSLGAPDYVDLKYLRKRDERSDEVDCHVPLFDAVNPVKSSFRKFAMPSHDAMSDPKIAESAEIKVPSRSGYNAALWGIYKQSGGKVRYFGQHRGTGDTDKCSTISAKSWLVNDEAKKVLGEELPPSTKTFFERKSEKGIRCPCPALPSTLPPENRTADPARVHGRLIHASHMAIAYMLLTPIGCFVARYYKETFVTIFCFQEYWWFMWHVVCLLAACLFNIGAITSIARKKQTDLVYNDNLIFHVIFGAISIFIFYMEIITGFFRVSDPKKRIRQIFLHVLSMFAMAFVNQSGFSCNVAYTTIFWLLFVITCYVLMEMDMRKADKKLHLVPRRSYLPPPVKRLFTKEPPGREFRLTMLAVFIFGLVAIQFLLSYFIWETSDAISCQEEWIAYNLKRRRFAPNPSSVAGGGGGGGAGSYYY
ncbi:hypothetical protein Ocin01_00311 [Orchesella cincta]|uniref:Malectin domain-containing protein n=1 Tax=Orchesella cincta TaxID=48709 RepID=A0A1D2NMB2_ORCCI|nr:hypothetical protein Ocin01_00311 [Orchesella cincta]